MQPGLIAAIAIFLLGGCQAIKVEPRPTLADIVDWVTEFDRLEYISLAHLGDDYVVDPVRQFKRRATGAEIEALVQAMIPLLQKPGSSHRAVVVLGEIGRAAKSAVPALQMKMTLDECDRRRVDEARLSYEFASHFFALKKIGGTYSAPNACPTPPPAA